MEPVRAGELHPLQNPSVLKEIFEKLELDDLKSCRLVCREWCEGSGDAMRDVASVVRIGDEDGQRISDFLDLVRVEGEEEEEEVYSVPPFMKHFEFQILEVDSQTFWEICGAQVKSLSLVGVTFQSADIFRHAIFQMCPNLEELEMNAVKVCGPQAPEPKEWVPPQYPPNRNLKSLSFFGGFEEFSIGWLEMLSQFPCLQKLNVMEMYEQYEDIFGALEVARNHDPNFWKISEVELWDKDFISIPLSFLRVFGEGDLVLTGLSIGLGGGGVENSEEDVTAIRRLLVAHVTSLQKLCISHNSVEIFPLPNNQVFEKVEDLELIGVRFRSTRFLEAFPNVEKLMLDVEVIPMYHHTPQVTLDKCTRLVLLRLLPLDDFGRLIKLLPNLKQLMIGQMYNKRFLMMCKGWPDLTHLEICEPGLELVEHRLNEVALTGYDKKDLKKISRKGDKNPWRPITARRANLSSLKNLESFCWKLSSKEYSKLGYCFVACGILELPKLKYLNVELEDNEAEPLPLFHSLAGKFTWNRAQEKIFD